MPEEKKINISEHEFVPKHELLSETEAETLLNELGIKRLNLPKIFKNDPAIKEHKLEYGDIIKITRKSETAGKTEYYRVVI